MSARTESTFVTAVGWTFVVLGALLLCIALVQNLLFALLSPLASGIADWEVMPRSARWVALNLRWFLLANLALGIAAVTASIGLVLRREWARLLFVLLMALGILWNLAVAGLQWDFTSSVLARVVATNPDDTGFRVFIAVVRIASFTFAAAFCGLFGWIAHRLLQPDITAEFR